MLNVILRYKILPAELLFFLIGHYKGIKELTKNRLSKASETLRRGKTPEISR